MDASRIQASHQQIPPLSFTRTGNATPVQSFSPGPSHRSPSLSIPPISSINRIMYQHPNGRTYVVFRCDSPPMRVVSQVVPSSESSVVQWVYSKVTEYRANNTSIPASVEICVLPSGDDFQNHRYYFVDHEGHQVFWPDPVTGSLPPMFSSSPNAVTDVDIQYWAHVECFPSHNPVGYDPMVDRLEHLLLIGTTPNGAPMHENTQARTQLFQDIKYFRGVRRLNSGAANYYIARCWRYVARYNVRLPLERLDHKFTLFNILLCFVPETYMVVFEDSLAHRTVRSAQQEDVDWGRITFKAFLVYLWSITLALAQFGSCLLAVLSAILSGLSFLTGTFLLIKYRSVASFATPIQMRGGTMPRVPGLAAAIVFSLPRALFIWSVSANTANMIFWVSIKVGRSTFMFTLIPIIILVSALRAVVLGLLTVTHQ